MLIFLQIFLQIFLFFLFKLSIRIKLMGQAQKIVQQIYT